MLSSHNKPPLRTVDRLAKDPVPPLNVAMVVAVRRPDQVVSVCHSTDMTKDAANVYPSRNVVAMIMERNTLLALNGRATIVASYYLVKLLGVASLSSFAMPTNVEMA